MGELSKFFILLKKYRFVLIIIPIVTVIITYFLVRNLPDSFTSQGQIATGIVDQTKQNLLNETTPQAQQIVQEFSNLIAMMKMKKMLDLVSYKLIIHDLTSSKPFRKPSQQFIRLSGTLKVRSLDVIRKMYNNGTSLNLYNIEENSIYDLIKSMGYDSESLNGKLSIFRSGDSDFIILQCESEDPELSAYVVNELSTEFIKYYSSIIKSNQIKTTDFLANLLKQKNDTLSNRMGALRDYKIKNRVLNLDEQSKQLYTRIINYDDKRQEATQNTSSYAGALNEIDKKFSPNERKYVEATLSKLNQNIVSTKEELSALYDQYYESDMDEKYKTSIDSIQRILSEEINKSSDQYINNPLSTKLALIQQKLTLEVQLDLSRYSINSLEKELTTLNGQFDQLVPKEADVQSLEMNVDIASKEYLDILNRFNQSSLESSFEVKLNIVQLGMPGLAQPSKKMLLVILSGIISFIFCVAIIFVLYFLDDSMKYPKDLANKTQLPVLGTLNLINTEAIELNKIWQDETSSISIQFKNQLRSIRYEIEAEMQSKIIMITSLGANEGKTLLAISLAYAWQMAGKKVLLIDGNFNSPEITKSTKANQYIEDLLLNRLVIDTEITGGSMTILGNRGGDISLVELTDQQDIIKKLASLKALYDIILVETPSLDNLNQSKEWFLFSNNVIAVFENGNSINEKKNILIENLKSTGLFRGWILNKTTSI
jgi:succinoglycan biosynthesis transport protein ExoP